MSSDMEKMEKKEGKRLMVFWVAILSLFASLIVVAVLIAPHKEDVGEVKTCTVEKKYVSKEHGSGRVAEGYGTSLLVDTKDCGLLSVEDAPTVRSDGEETISRKDIYDSIENGKRYDFRVVDLLDNSEYTKGVIDIPVENEK